MLQKINGIGNLGRDPEMRFTPNGAAVTKFSVACNRKYKAANGEDIEEVAWLNISAWGRLAEVCNEYLHKGAQVYFEGRLSPDLSTGGPRVWTGDDGVARASYEITASTVQFLKTDRNAANGQAPQTVEAGGETIAY